MKANTHKQSKITYGLEFFIFFLMLIGLYFIMSDIDLPTLLERVGFFLGNEFITLKQAVLRFSNTTLAHLRVADMVGIVIIGLTIILSLLRFRYRLVLARDLVEECPQCGTRRVRQSLTWGQQLITKSLGLQGVSLRCRECHKDTLVFRYRVSRTGKR